MISIFDIFKIAAALAFTAQPALAEDSVSPNACRNGQHATALDFWIGEWTVQTQDGKVVGHNRIYPILDGCALREEWRGADGSEGQSLFYYDAIAGNWEQVWVTGDTSKPGGLKRKSLIRVDEDGSVWFQGEPSVPGGGTYHDRTQLQPLDEGKVRQVIQISTDGGKTWQPRFDAIYIRDPLVIPAKAGTQ